MSDARPSKAILVGGQLDFLAGVLAAGVASILPIATAGQLAVALAAWAAMGAALLAIGRRFPGTSVDPAGGFEALFSLARQAGVENLRLLRIRPGRWCNAEALAYHVCGRPIVAISEDLFHVLSPSQLLATFAHELGHIRLGHSKRKWFLCAFGQGMFVAGMTLLFSSVLEFSPSGPDSGRVLEAFGIMSLAMSPMILMRFRRLPVELAADRWAIRHTGDPDSVFSSLRKLAELSGKPQLAQAIERRIALIREEANCRGSEVIAS